MMTEEEKEALEYAKEELKFGGYKVEELEKAIDMLENKVIALESAIETDEDADSRGEIIAKIRLLIDDVHDL